MWLVRASLVASLVCFVTLGLWQARTFMVWSEEIIVHAMPAAALLEPEPDGAGAPRLEPSCAEARGPIFVHSASRPTLNACFHQRAFPILIAPYFSGWLYWPFSLLEPLHHDDAYLLRRLSLLLGVLSIIATFGVVRRFAGDGAAALTALTTAVSPCFVLVHSTLVHFETMPWLCLMSSLLCFLRCPGLDPRVAATTGAGATAGLPTRWLVLGALLIGAAVAANAKSVVLIAPLGLLAVWLGVPVRRIPWRAWARMGIVGLLPVLPMIALQLAPANGYGDNSSGWFRTLLEHVRNPGLLVSSARDFVLLETDVAYYFGHMLEAPRLHVVAVTIGVGAAAFVLVDAARTIKRRRGCPVTAACGVSIVTFTLMVSMLYDHFPSNFTPLHTVFAASVAMATWRLGGWVAATTSTSYALVPIAAAVLLAFGWSSVDGIRAIADIRVHTNAVAVRSLVAYLDERASEGARVFTADTMMAGVVDSLSQGRVATVRAHELFSSCRPMKRNPSAPACVEERWRKLLPFLAGGTADGATRSLRFVAPADWSAWGSDHISYVPALERAAPALGYRVTLERTFTTARGLPALDLFRLDPIAVAPTR